MINIPEGALVVMVGISGSGKSTFAQRLPLSVLISTDEIRRELTGDASDMAASAEAFAIARERADTALGLGLTTIIDAISTHPRARQQWIELAAAHRAPAVAIVCALPIEECLRANAARSRVVPQDVIRRQHATLVKHLGAINSEGFEAVYVLRTRAEQQQRPVGVGLSDAGGVSL